MEGNASSGETQSSKPKKAKLSPELAIDDNSVSSSPDLHHKLPLRASQQESEEDSQEGQAHTNLFGVNFLMWFDIGIEGKSPMDQDEDDWGGRLEFGFSENNFPKEIEDYFLLFEDKCSQSHHCAGRVMGVLSNQRKHVIEPPDYDPRNIVDLLDKYRDAHISDSGWREVDPEEWKTEN